MELPASYRGAALVAKGSRVLLESYSGLADASAGVATDASTRFQISVSGWFDRSPHSWDAVTIENLLTHTAGFGQWAEYPDINPGAAITDDAFVAALRVRPLPEDLPAAHVYSAPGYGRLVRIVEQASGKMYTKFVTEKIFNPLKMRDTFVGNAHRRTAIARGYRGDDPVPSWELDTAGRGTGDVWSTARDLDKWDAALSTDALFPAATRDTMFEPHAPIDGDPVVRGYGYGWVVGELHGQPLALHPGNNPGYASLNAIIPTMHVRVILLSNDETSDVYTAATNLIEAAITG